MTFGTRKAEQEGLLVGFYDYTLILTLMSLVSAVFGMTRAIQGHTGLALGCLMLSGVCDGFDGKVARTKKNRTQDERSFGIQLDSLCDMAAFGAFPAVLCHSLGVRGALGCVALCFYCVCAVIRLSYYNVVELNRMLSPQPTQKVYHGLPITSITIILPAVYLLKLVMAETLFPVVLIVMLFVVGSCFILDFKIYHPGRLVLFGLAGLLAIAAVILLLSGQHGLTPLVG